ncbi:MAG: 1-phosphofructokinase family hexose kinase [Anaerolineae bacterium]|nr:1-phosphofructokinase family hexose kinase [Anaerolineae bacterium]
MILAINTNAALDRVVFIDRFVPNTSMRTNRSALSIGGKGLDAALVLQTLGAPVKAVSFMAGKNGEILADLLDKNKIDKDLIWLPGETREANVIVETDFNRHSHITTYGYKVTRKDCDTLLARIALYAPQTQWAVMAGSLPEGAPAGYYREMIELLHSRGVKTLIDNQGAPMLEALAAQPEIVKMNQHEFQDTFKMPVENQEQLIQACLAQMEHHRIKSMVITCGKDGILVFTSEGILQGRCALEVKEINAAGAGDAVSAALAYRLSLGDSWSQALSWAVATSVAVIKTEGTAECYLSDIMEIYPNTWVKALK